MKTRTLFIVLLFGLCNQTFSQVPPKRLIGKWHLDNTSGGMTGKGFPIKKNSVIEFTLDYTYKSYEQDTLKYLKTYKVLKSPSKYRNRDSVNMVQIGTSLFNKHEFFFHKNKLILREPYVEGFTRTYQKVVPK